MESNETIPSPAPSDTPQNEPGPDFERLKYFIDLGKWFITSVALVLITLIIDTGFRDRNAGMQEISQYDKYVTELIVLNPNPASRRNLAQFFSFVTPSRRLRDGWKAYYKLVDPEYRAFIQPAQRTDSVLRAEQSTLLQQPVLSPADSARLQHVNTRLEETQSVINPEIVLPAATTVNTAPDWEMKGFQALLSNDIDQAITAFTASEVARPSYHMVYEIGNYLKKNRESLKDPKSAAWATTRQWVLANASWGMPPAIKTAMQ